MSQINCWKYKVISKNWHVGVGLYFFTFLIFLSPLINIIDYVGGSIPILYYAFLAIFGIIAAFPVKKEYLPVVFVAGIVVGFSIFGSPVKGAAAALSFYVAYKGIRQSESVFFRALFTLLIINYLITLLQLSGVYEIAYSFVTYANEASPISFLEVEVIDAYFLPQMRPSGIFPATSYVSFFCIALYSMGSFLGKRNDKYFMAMTGSFFVLTGSTLGFALILLLAMNVLRDKIIIWALMGYVFTGSIYFTLLPEIAAYNFSMTDFSASVLNRSMDESILTLNPMLLVVMTLVFLFIIFYIKVNFRVRLFSTIPVVAMIFFPVLLHDASGSLLGFFMLGIGVGMVGTLIKRPA